jgi:phenylalanine-4-hydroxylase
MQDAFCAHLHAPAPAAFIAQDWSAYTDENHLAWSLLYERRMRTLRETGSRVFLEGAETIGIGPTRVPDLREVNDRLGRRTGWQAVPVSGFLPAKEFFACLAQRRFPTTVGVRPMAQLDYLPEPDIFHDIAGHVPMHTDKAFADTLVRFGEAARTAADIVAGVKDREERVRRVTSIFKALARFFWFTIEFGLMKSQDGKGLKVYGSGLLSSYGEIAHSIDSPDVQRFPFQLEWVVNQYFEIDHYQPLLYYVDSFDHLFELVNTLEKWMKQGKLNNVSPGEPSMSTADVDSFLEAGRAA